MDLRPRLLGEQLVLTLDLADSAVITADRNQMEHALINLCINARDAMPLGGTLSISTALVGEEVELAVTDSGVGMSQETIAHVFEPFFTTKPPHQGTGLGLSLSHGIIERHGGRISVHSAPGQGARFVIELPLDAPATDE